MSHVSSMTPLPTADAIRMLNGCAPAPQGLFAHENGAWVARSSTRDADRHDTSAAFRHVGIPASLPLPCTPRRDEEDDGFELVSHEDANAD